MSSSIKISPDTRTVDIGFTITRTGKATLDTEFGEVSKFIMTSIAGPVLVVGTDGRNIILPSVPANELYPVACTKILTSGNDWQGNAWTTIAGADFYFFGGV